MQYKDIVGQEKIKDTLRRMVDEERVPHAMMFTGRQGVGKLPIAIATAQYLCCENRHDGDSCGECRSCRQFAKLQHPDVSYIFPIARNKERGITLSEDAMPQFRKEVLDNPYISIEQWLSIISDGKMGWIYTEEGQEITRKVNYKPYQSDKKVLIIWIAEKMHEACANSILKLLEEPPLDTVFILVADNPELILGTITSRCRQFAVPPISKEALNAALDEQIAADHDTKNYLVRNSMGSWNKLLNLMSQNDEASQNLDLFKRMMRLAWTLNIKEIRTWTEEVNTLSREQQISFMQNAQRLIRENFIMRVGNKDLNYMTVDEEGFARQFSQFIHERNVVEIMEELELAERQIQQNGNARIVLFHLEILLYKLLKKPRT